LGGNVHHGNQQKQVETSDDDASLPCEIEKNKVGVNGIEQVSDYFTVLRKF
jgi:hypothetical protein